MNDVAASFLAPTGAQDVMMSCVRYLIQLRVKGTREASKQASKQVRKQVSKQVGKQVSKQVSKQAS